MTAPATPSSPQPSNGLGPPGPRTVSRPTEAELLDLIEGGLSPAREREVRAAAAADPELAGQVLRMMQHRSMLRQLDESIEARAPADLAEQAVLRARSEHMQQMEQQSAGSTDAYRTGRHGSRRSLALAAALAVVTLGGWVWFMVWRVGPNSDINTYVPYRTPYMQHAKTPESEAPAVAQGESEAMQNFDAYGNEIERVVADSVAASASFDPDFIGPPVVGAITEVRDPMATGPGQPAPQREPSLLGEWMANLGEIADETITPARAAELLNAGKLRIIVRSAPSAELRARVAQAAKGNGGGPLSPADQGVLASARGATEPEEVSALELDSRRRLADRAMVVVIQRASDRSALQESLANLLERIKAVSGTEARFDEAVPNEDPLAGLEAADLLWWTKPQDQWDGRSVLRVPVVFVGREPAATPPR